MMEQLLSYNGPLLHVDHSRRCQNRVAVTTGVHSNRWFLMSRAQHIQVEKLKKEIEDLQTVVKDLNDDLNSKRQKLDEQGAATAIGREAKRRVIARQQSQVAQLSAQVTILKNELETSENETGALKRSLETLQQRALELRTQVESLENEKRAFQTQLKTASETLAKVQGEAAVANKKLRETEREKGKLQTTLAEAQAASTAAIGALETKLKRAEAASEASRETANVLKAELAKAQAESTATTDDLNARLEAAESANEALKTRLKVVEDAQQTMGELAKLTRDWEFKSDRKV